MNFKIFLQHIISRLENNEQVEENKLELKRQWYDFAASNKKNDTISSEFLKDIVSIANTPGPTGHLIIGVDEKNGNLKNSPLIESGINEITVFHNLITRNVDLPIKFDFKEVRINDDILLSVFTIPPSIDKPHVIKLYQKPKGVQIQNYIPIRKTTGIFPASRSDFEFMFYDRKNVQPEYAVDFKVFKPHLPFNAPRGTIETNITLAIQNYGTKPVALTEFHLLITPEDNIDLNIDAPIRFNMKTYVYPADKTYHEQSGILIVKQNEILKVNLRCESEKKSALNDIFDLLQAAKEISFSIECKDVDSNSYTSKKLKSVKP